MKSKIAIAAIAAAVAMPMAATAPAAAQSYYDQGYDGRYYPTRYDADRAYRGRDRHYYQDCRRSSGTTGAIAGGAGGAILGNVLGGGTLGTIAGAVGGGLLGRHLDKQHDADQNYRNGC